jgi:transposase
MLTVPANARLFLYQTPVRMHKSFEGLSGLVQEMFPGELLSGAFFIFLSRQKDHMKVLYWDGDGFVIFYKRLEKGSFSVQKNGSPSIARKEFLMLLEGITPQRLQKRFSL